MLEAISSLQNHPPLACPTCSVNQAMSTNGSFPVLPAFSNKASSLSPACFAVLAVFVVWRRTKQFHIPPDYSGVHTLAGRRRSRFHHMPGLTHEFFDRIRHQLLLAQLTPDPQRLQQPHSKNSTRPTMEACHDCYVFKNIDSISALNHAFRPSGCGSRSSPHTVFI